MVVVVVVGVWTEPDHSKDEQHVDRNEIEVDSPAPLLSSPPMLRGISRRSVSSEQLKGGLGLTRPFIRDELRVASEAVSNIVSRRCQEIHFGRGALSSEVKRQRRKKRMKIKNDHRSCADLDSSKVMVEAPEQTKSSSTIIREALDVADGVFDGVEHNVVLCSITSFGVRVVPLSQSVQY
ncbi:hypothetical protein INR49_004003 [Caranx melampygus]|nr:hypothetical protein INR49_004003 [Caranx melampygus]